MLATALGILGGAAEIVVSAVWFLLVARVKVPSDRRPFTAAHAVTVGLGVVALALGAHGLGAALAWFAIVGGGTFLALQTQSAQARKTPAVAVGGPVIEFTLPDHAGRPFDLASLRGTPFLLKFFRGHW